MKKPTKFVLTAAAVTSSLVACGGTDGSDPTATPSTRQRSTRPLSTTTTSTTTTTPTTTTLPPATSSTTTSSIDADVPRKLTHTADVVISNGQYEVGCEGVAARIDSPSGMAFRFRVGPRDVGSEGFRNDAASVTIETPLSSDLKLEQLNNVSVTFGAIGTAEGAPIIYYHSPGRSVFLSGDNPHEERPLVYDHDGYIADIDLSNVPNGTSKLVAIVTGYKPDGNRVAELADVQIAIARNGDRTAYAIKALDNRGSDTPALWREWTKGVPSCEGSNLEGPVTYRSIAG